MRLRERLERAGRRFIASGRHADDVAFLRCVAAVSFTDVRTVIYCRRRAAMLIGAHRAFGGALEYPPAMLAHAQRAIRLGWYGVGSRVDGHRLPRRSS